MLIISPEFNCSQDILTIVAMLSGTFFWLHVLMRLIVSLAVPKIWVRPNDKRKEADIAKQLLSIPEGDHLTLLNVFDEYQSSAYRSNISSPLLTKISPDLRDRKWAWNNFVSARSLTDAANVRAQILRIMERLEINLETKPYKDQTKHYMDIRRALVCGYFTQVAQKSGEGSSYLTIKDNEVRPPRNLRRWIPFL
jgi:pre-mRNA-splicing factor ATP-dependent RNA helicase DHX15/PRP43